MLDLERFGVQLGLLTESGGRVQSAIGRVMRWGLGAIDTRSNESNRDALLRELDDLKDAIGRVERALMSTVGELPIAPIVTRQRSEGPVSLRLAPSCTCGHVFESPNVGRICPMCRAFRAQLATLNDGTPAIEANDAGRAV